MTKERVLHKLTGLVVAIAIVGQPGLIQAMPIASHPLKTSIDRAEPPRLYPIQYYYKGHKYKQRTRQHFIRKYHGNDRS